jgi:Fe-S cluster assembly iron-binding protein IscA
MVSTSNRAAEQLREQLIDKCSEIGIGFRMLVSTDEFGQTNFSIKLDRRHQEDEVIETNGVKIFLDSASAARISDYQLDYQDELDGGFFLKKAQEAKSGQD